MTPNFRSRLALFFNIKTSAALDQIEDPREVLDYAYGQQQLHLRTVRRGLLEVAAARQQLEAHARGLTDRAARLDAQARRAVAREREDLARQALQRKHACLAETRAVDAQRTAIARDEDRLRAAEQQLAQRVARFRFHRGVAQARYAAAEAQVSVGEALSGLGSSVSEETELSLAVERSEERIDRLSARAQAITALDLGGGEPVDAVEQELTAAETADAVEADLAALRDELGSAAPPTAGPAAEETRIPSETDTPEGGSPRGK